MSLALTAPVLQIVLAATGVTAGSAIAFASPRLAAHRLQEPPNFAPFAVLVPIIGVWLSAWRPVRTLLLEMLTSLTFVGLSMRYGWSIQLLLACLYSVLLISIADIDIDYRLVLNRLSYPGAILALLGGVFWPGIGWQSAVMGAVAGFVCFAVLQIVGRGALGMGDTKLALLIGAMRGIPGVANALFVGIILGGLGAAVALLVLRRGRKEYIAYAPYLAGGAILSFFLTSP